MLKEIYFQSAIIIGLGLLWGGCHPGAPVSSAAPTPPETVRNDTEEVVPEVVTNQLNLAAEDSSGCTLYPEAAERIWGYEVQSKLNLSVQVYEGIILAADAETLVNTLEAFTSGWKSRFATLCDNNEKRLLAPKQFEEGARCLSELLGRQKDYVNGLFHQRRFVLSETDAVTEHLTDCDNLIIASGDKAFKENPF